MSEIKEIITKEEFKDFINKDKPVLVDFFATWCYPCKMQTPILHELLDDIREKALIIKVDVDVLGEIAVEYNINSIPALMLFKNGELKDKKIGLTTKAELSEMILKNI